MQRVLANLRRSLEDHPREVFAVYFNPRLSELFDKAAFLTRLRSGRKYAIYKGRQGGHPEEGLGRCW